LEIGTLGGKGKVGIGGADQGGRGPAVIEGLWEILILGEKGKKREKKSGGFVRRGK